MKDKLNLWRVYNQATAYGIRPSNIFKFETEIGAWVFDEACLLIGRKFEKLLNDGKNPFENIPNFEGQRSYAPIANGNIKRVKINANGTW